MPKWQRDCDVAGAADTDALLASGEPLFPCQVASASLPQAWVGWRRLAVLHIASHTHLERNEERSLKLMRLRFPLMFLALLGLMIGIWAGLARMGWDLGFQQSSWSVVHGPLMISGFLGTVIGLELAVALGHGWGYGAPLLSGLGSAALIIGLPDRTGPLLIGVASVMLLAIFGIFLTRQLEFYLVTMALGALAWLVGNVLWIADWQIPRLVPLRAGFLILTIVGERLELNRLTRPTGAVRFSFAIAVALLFIGLITSALDLESGWTITGIGILALALWLTRFDIARRTVRRPGLPRFIALSLFAGYLWLVVGALLALSSTSFVGGPTYDALMHALFLGFVFSMIFAHASIIFPALTGIDVPFRKRFYVHLVLLHASLIVRVAGDLGNWLEVRQWGGMINAIALLMFLLSTALAARSARRDIADTADATFAQGGGRR